ncbi:hypothetical protein [Burkholderia contaminans]|uniref:hypothetical protein n=1 Tax=Burkholderia contaminans TaxID=488447 RepID=UPI001CF1B3A0|nr:hypothetical protein [Burkholderia contaminans]MCA8102908.1 hypothetical protein [Burkholderia contaminans]
MTQQIPAEVAAAAEGYHAARREFAKLCILSKMRHADSDRAVNQLAQVGIDRAYAEMQSRLDHLLQLQRAASLPPLAELEAAAIQLRDASNQLRGAIAAGDKDRQSFEDKFNEAETLFRTQLARFVE